MTLATKSGAFDSLRVISRVQPSPLHSAGALTTEQATALVREALKSPSGPGPFGHRGNRPGDLLKFPRLHVSAAKRAQLQRDPANTATASAGVRDQTCRSSALYASVTRPIRRIPHPGCTSRSVPDCPPIIAAPSRPPTPAPSASPPISISDVRTAASATHPPRDRWLLAGWSPTAPCRRACRALDGLRVRRNELVAMLAAPKGPTF
jgi:hypothetical protein